MTTYNANILEHFNSTARFDLWATAMHNLLVGAGWVQTADTGQVNVATVAMPAINVYAGYRIYALADALQATAPIFLKVEFGTGGALTKPRIQVTFGTGSNGAGLLTNPSTPHSLGQENSLVVDRVRAAYACSLPGIAVLSAGDSALNYSLGFAVERWRNADGTPNALGWSYIVYSAPGTIVGERTFSVSANGWRSTTPATSFSCFVPLSTPSSSNEGADIGVFPHIPCYGMAKPPGLCFVTYFNADIAIGSLVSIMRYGIAHTYCALGGAMYPWASYSNLGTFAPAMIYE